MTKMLVFPNSTNQRKKALLMFYTSLQKKSTNILVYASLQSLPHAKCIKYILTELLYILYYNQPFHLIYQY